MTLQLIPELEINKHVNSFSVHSNFQKRVEACNVTKRRVRLQTSTSTACLKAVCNTEICVRYPYNLWLHLHELYQSLAYRSHVCTASGQLFTSKQVHSPMYLYRRRQIFLKSDKNYNQTAYFLNLLSIIKPNMNCTIT